MLAVVALDSTNLERRVRLANVYFGAADAYRSFHKGTAALQLYEKSKAIFESRRISDPKSAYFGLKTAACWQFMGVTELSLGNLQTARDDFRSSLTLADPFFAATPPNLQAVYDVADSYSGLGDVESAEAVRSPSDADRHHRSARSAYRQSLAAWKKVDHPSPSSPWGFDAGNPKKVAASLARCEKALQRTNP